MALWSSIVGFWVGTGGSLGVWVKATFQIPTIEDHEGSVKGPFKGVLANSSLQGASSRFGARGPGVPLKVLFILRVPLGDPL